MSSQEFALLVLVVIIAFLTFALTMVVIFLGDKHAKAETRKIFQAVIKKLVSLLPR